MSVRGIRELTAKQIVASLTGAPAPQAFHIRADDLRDVPALGQANSWALAEDVRLVVKPDQLVKRRGKNGLIKVGAMFGEAVSWAQERMHREVKLKEGGSGTLDTFLVEPLVPHADEDEMYVAITSGREADEILFCSQGGVDVGDVDAKAQRLEVRTGDEDAVDEALVKDRLLMELADGEPKDAVAKFIAALYTRCYVPGHFALLEINPLVWADGRLHALDMAATLDETAHFVCEGWGEELEFPPAFGRPQTEEELRVKAMDARTGASLKLTVLNDRGRVWTMVAGGGASVVYADTVCDLGFSGELANYGEYSGAPSTEETYEYARTLLELMLKHPDVKDKVLIIGGGIANFTDVARTFTGVIKALTSRAHELLAAGVQIWVRRAGLNTEAGLAMMRQCGADTGLPITVFGAEVPMTRIVRDALIGVDAAAATFPTEVRDGVFEAAAKATRREAETRATTLEGGADAVATEHVDADNVWFKAPPLFTSRTQALVYNFQPAAVQRMLDFDFLSGRSQPSVAGFVFPFGASNQVRVHWGTKEVFLPVYKSFEEAFQAQAENIDLTFVVNFASFRSAFDSTAELLALAGSHPQCRVTGAAVIAEGMPERQARALLKQAREVDVTLIGPATVGGLRAGCFRIGNSGGALENIIASGLFSHGHVSYVSRSGGMSNELNNMIKRCADGVREGVAVGGDRYPGSRFVDHLLRYEADAGCKLLVLLGEVGGTDEYDVADLVREGRITKPVVAWCVGTCSEAFSNNVQFGHAGAQARKGSETAKAKNAALREAGCLVPESFDSLGDTVNAAWLGVVSADSKLLKRVLGSGKHSGDAATAAERLLDGATKTCAKVEDLDVSGVTYNVGKEHLLPKETSTLLSKTARKKANFVCTISDDRGEELTYCGVPITKLVGDHKTFPGLGSVIGLLWFRRRLPRVMCEFLDLAVKLCADHGPAVCGAHNTIVATRAGKDLVSSLCSGLLTIGPRFGGALDDAAASFSHAFDFNQRPQEFIRSMKKQGKLIMGIGHRVKSKTNPDMRVECVKDFVRAAVASGDLPLDAACVPVRGARPERRRRNSVGSSSGRAAEETTARGAYGDGVLQFALDTEDETTKKKANLILNVDGAIACAFVDMVRMSGCFTKEEADTIVAHGALNGLFVLARTIGFIGHHLDQKRMSQGLYRHAWEDIFYADVAGSGGQER